MIVFFLLVAPSAAALLVILGDAPLTVVLGPVLAMALVLLVTAWVTDARQHRRPLPPVTQRPAVPPLPAVTVRQWHHVPPPVADRTADQSLGQPSEPPSTTTTDGESYGSRSRHAA